MVHPFFRALPCAFAFSTLAPVMLASADAAELPDTLVLHFDPSAAALDQTAIRFAVEKELGVRADSSGAVEAATLRVSVNPTGEVELSYQPERARYTRSVPLTETRDIPTLIAHLAGNMVRDEAGMLLEQLAPAPPPSGAVAPAEGTPSAAPAAPAPVVDGAATSAEYLTDRWLMTFLFGASFSHDEAAALSIAGSRRLGRWELGLSVELDAGRVDAELEPDAGDTEQIRVSATQLSVMAGTDFRVLGREEAQLQLGAAAGYRLAGIVAGSKLSGSNGDPAFAPRVTAVFKLRGRHNLLLRGSWFVTPRTHTISASDVQTLNGESNDGTVITDAFALVAQVGYQVGF